MVGIKDVQDGVGVGVVNTGVAVEGQCWGRESLRRSGVWVSALVPVLIHWWCLSGSLS